MNCLFCLLNCLDFEAKISLSVLLHFIPPIEYKLYTYMANGKHPPVPISSSKKNDSKPIQFTLIWVYLT